MKVFLTGGTGSLGKAILRRAGPDDEYTVYSRDEFKQSQLRAKYPDHRFILGDVRDENWLTLCMRGHDVVIHTAAYKHVPQSEMNAAECMEINVLGSRAVTRAAIRTGVTRVVGISTDKACAPMSMYGASKMVMERLFAQANLLGETVFNCVRYGNVLGSRGSVVPLFREQIANQGYVTITDPEMTRFWLTLEAAVMLVKMGLLTNYLGVTIVPKLRSCTMLDLANAIDAHVNVKVIGRRPGERIHERLIHAGEAINAYDDGACFFVFPTFKGIESNLSPDFEYSSDKAQKLTKEEIREMIEAYDREEAS